VLEAAGGTVVNGLYTAPRTPGAYHVVAASTASPSVQAVATVTVGPEKVLSVAATPPSVQVRPGGAVSFQADVTTSCGTFRAN
jgi:hypothetical protein